MDQIDVSASSPPSAADHDRAAIVRTTVQRLEALDAASSHSLSSLAFVLSRVAEADGRLPLAELEEMERVLAREAHIDPELAVLAVEIARHRRRLADCATTYRASRELRCARDVADRNRLLEALVDVAAADGELHRDEQDAILQVAVELGLSAATARRIMARRRA